MILRLSRLGLLILTVLMPLPALAQDTGFAEAFAAFQSESYETARSLLQPLADSGDRRAQFLLGHLYLNGLAVEADSDRAARWFARAAAPPAPDRYALFNLGVLYERGDGVAEDLERAREFYRAAADRGVPAAMANLGALLARGDGGDRDLVAALGLFHRALEAGHPGAGASFDRLAGAVAHDPPVVGGWQVIGYSAAADAPALAAAPESLASLLGAPLDLGRRQLRLGTRRCNTALFLASDLPPSLTVDRLTGASVALSLPEGERPFRGADILCGRDRWATLASLPDGRLAMAAVGGFALLDRRPSPMVAEAQERLTALGYEPGPVDGFFGPRTRAAIVDFQTDNRQRPTGGLSSATMDALATAEHRNFNGEPPVVDN